MDNFDYKKYLSKNPLTEAYTPGSGWTQDFDYDDMLAHGLKLNANSPIEDLEKVFADFEDVNYHREAEPLSYAIDAIKAGDRGEAKMYINKFHKELKKTIADYSDEYFNVSEEKLHEAMSPQDVVDIADTVAEEFTIESEIDGDFLIYTVGKMEADDMSFELDTDVSSQTPKDLDTRGVGEGWGGIFRIKPTADGYEVRNAEKGGLVAMIDSSGNFRMLSAAESRDELDMDRYNDELDMKDDERNPGMYIDDEEWEREMGRMEENKYNPDLDQDDEEVPMPMDDEGRPLGESKEEKKSNKMKKSELKEMIRNAFLNETEIEEIDMLEAEEEEVTVDDTEEIDIDTDAETADAGEVDVEADAEVEMTGDKKEVQDNLQAALEAAKALGDQKLVDQIGNSITFFTRTHVVGNAEVAEASVDVEVDSPVEDAEVGMKLEESINRMKKLAGLIK